MVGRAGRLGFTERGRSVIIARDPRSEHLAWGQYVTGSPEDLRSRFLDADPRALILRALATVAGPGMAGQMSGGELIEFLENSWGVFQRRAAQGEWAWDEEELRARLAELEQLEMVERDEAGNLGLLPLGRFAGEAGVAVETIVRLARVARNAPGLADDVSALALVQVTAELDEVYMPVNTRGWRKEASSWLQELARIGIARGVYEALRSHPDGAQIAARAKRAFGCVLWADGVPRRRIEQLLTRHQPANTIDGPVRGAISRTVDLLPTTMRVVEFVQKSDLTELESSLLLRLQLGIPASLVDLGLLCGDRLTRGQYLALADAGLTSPGDIEGAEDAVLASVLEVSAESARDLLRIPAAKAA